MEQTIIQIIISAIIGGLSGFFVVSFKMGGYVNIIDTLKDDSKEIKKESKEVRDKVIACETSLKERGPLVKNESPVSLTDRGIDILEGSGGKNFINENFTELLNEINKNEPKTAYDVQELSKKVLENIQDEDKFNIFKEYIFKEGLQIKDIILVLSIYLRDEVLKQRGWQIEDVDKNDPSLNSSL